jgi:hypothetical protein
MKKSSIYSQELYVACQLDGSQSFNALNWLEDGMLTKKCSSEHEPDRSDESRGESEIKNTEFIATICM